MNMACEYVYNEEGKNTESVSLAKENWDDCNGVIEYQKTIEEPSFRLMTPIMNLTHTIQSVLGADIQMTAVCDYDNSTINICVGSPDKEKAMRQWFPGTVEMGNEKITVLVNGHKKTYETTYDYKTVTEALQDNPLFSRTVVTYFPKYDEDGNPVDDGNLQIDKIFIMFNNVTVKIIDDNFCTMYVTDTYTAEGAFRKMCKDMNIRIPGLACTVSTHAPLARCD